MEGTLPPNNPPLTDSDTPQTNGKHRLLFSLLLAGILVIVIGLVLWLVSMNKPGADTPVPVEVSAQDKLRSEIAQQLEDIPMQASPTELNRAATTLSKSKKTISDADRARVASMLENL